MPCCCGSRVAGSGNPKRSRAKRSASGVLPGIGEVLPGVRAGHTKIRARASKSRGTRRDVAFASGCSETRFPRIAKPRCETASRNGRRGRRRARYPPRPDAPRAKPDRRPWPKDGRPTSEADRPARPDRPAHQRSGQGPGSSHRKPGWKPDRPTGPSGGGDRGWKPSRPGEQSSGGGDRGWKPSRPQGQGTGGGDRGWKPSRPQRAEQLARGDRGWKPSRPAGQGSGDRSKPGRPPGKAGGDNRGWKPNRPPGRPMGQGGRGGRPPGRGGRKGGGGGSSR